MVFAYFFRFADKLRFYPLKRTLTSLLLTLRNTGYMVRIGFATFLTELAMSVMMLTGNYMFISMLGEEGVAAFAIACYLFPVVFSISNAVAQSAQPIISFNYGAHLLHRVSRTLRISVLTAVICGASVTVGLWAGSAQGRPPVSQSAGECIYAGGRWFAAICLVFRILFGQYRLYRLLSEHRESYGFHRIYAVAGHIVPCAVLRPVAPGIRCPRPMACHSGSGTADLCRHLHPIRQAEIRFCGTPEKELKLSDSFSERPRYC